MALVLASLSAENENRQLEDLPPADFGGSPGRLLLSVRTKSIIEFAPTHYTIVIQGCRFIYFHSSVKSAILLSKGQLCLYDKQNNTWLLVDMEFPSRVQLDEKFHIYLRQCIILYTLPNTCFPLDFKTKFS